MKLMKTTLIALTSMFALSALPAEATDLKVGVVNFKSCVEQSKMGKEEQKQFEAMKTKMESQIQEKEKGLSEVAAKLNDADYLDTLSADAEAELKHKFRTMSQELSQYQNQYYQVLNQANFKIVQKMHEAISSASTKIAKKQGIDLILNEEGSFYFSGALDISELVVMELDSSK